MSEISRPKEPTEIIAKKDYDAIEDAVMETARGRWFLAEYARRHRSADTEMLLGAISRLETMIKEQPSSVRADSITPSPLKADDVAEADADAQADKQPVEQLLLDVAELSAAIQLTRQEISELGVKHESEGGFEQASDELDAIVSHTEQATGEILNAAEAIQEATWKLREDGAAADICDTIDERAIEIYTACSFQDITGQRISKVVTLMGFTEKHVQRMMNIWHDQQDTGLQNGQETKMTDLSEEVDSDPEAGLLNGPALEGSGLEQSDIDNMLADDPFAGQDTFDSIEETLARAEAAGGSDPEE